MKFVDWCILSSLIVAFWVFDICVPALIDLKILGEYATFFFVGICIGQINLIGAWGALAPGKVIVRLPWAAFLGVSMWQAFVIGQKVDFGVSNADQFNLGISIGFGVVATQVPLWLARRPFRWRLLPPSFALDKLADTESQFNLKHLFVGIFFASLSLAMMRIILGGTSFKEFRLDHWLLAVLPVVAICNAMVTAPCLWLAFCQGRRLAGWLATGIVMVVLISGAETFVLTLLLGPPGGNDSLIVIFVMLTCLNLAQCLTVFGTMRLLRWMGFQLVRDITADQKLDVSQVNREDHSQDESEDRIQTVPELP